MLLVLMASMPSWVPVGRRHIVEPVHVVKKVGKPLYRILAMLLLFEIGRLVSFRDQIIPFLIFFLSKKQTSDWEQWAVDYLTIKVIDSCSFKKWTNVQKKKIDPRFFRSVVRVSTWPGPNTTQHPLKSQAAFVFFSLISLLYPSP